MDDLRKEMCTDKFVIRRLVKSWMKSVWYLGKLDEELLTKTKAYSGKKKGRQRGGNQ